MLALLVCVVLMVRTCTSLEVVSHSVPLTAGALIHTEDDMQTKTTKWCDGHNQEHSVSTVRGQDETIKDWCARHDEAVAAMQKMYPPEPCK